MAMRWTAGSQSHREWYQSRPRSYTPFRAKYFGSFSREGATSGCVARWSKRVVVPAFMAPMMTPNRSMTSTLGQTASDGPSEARVTEPTSIPSPDGEVPAMVSRPPGDPKGGVVVVQEAFGL